MSIIIEPEEVKASLPKTEIAAIVTYAVTIAVTIILITVGLIIHNDLITISGFGVLAIGLVPTLALIVITDRNNKVSESLT